MPVPFCLSAISAMTAALSMAVAPASAAELPVPVQAQTVPQVAMWDGQDDVADNHRYRRYRRNRGVDAGDVIAGVLVLGTIAAVASAASRNDRERDRYRDVRYRDRRDDDRRYSDDRGIDRAVDMCLAEIERDVRVEGVDNVSRTGEGWLVQGRLFDGQGFSCRIGNDGRIEDIGYGGRGDASAASYAPVEDRQFSEETYFKAWTDVDPSATGPEPQVRYTEVDYAPDEQRVPAYPGGPVDGDYYVAEGGR